MDGVFGVLEKIREEYKIPYGAWADASGLPQSRISEMKAGKGVNPERVKALADGLKKLIPLYEFRIKALGLSPQIQKKEKFFLLSLVLSKEEKRLMFDLILCGVKEGGNADS